MTAELFTIDVAVGEATPADVGEGETTDDGSFGFDTDEQTVVTVRNPPWTEAFGTDTFLKYDVTVAKSLEQTYVKDGEEYTFRKPPEELRKAAWSFDNAPYPIGGHPDGGLLRDVEDIRGFVREPTYDEDEQAVHAALYVPATDDEAQEWIADNKGVSPGFWNRLDWDTEEDGVDAYQRNLRIDHVAGVKVGRCSVEDGCGITADDRTVGHVLTDTPTRNKQDDTVPVGGQWVTFTDDGERRYGRRLDEDEERTLVRLWSDGRLTDRTVWVSTDSVELWAGPEMDSSDGAMDPKFSEGDWVRWEWSGGSARGRITNVSTSQTLSVEGTSRDPTEKGEPVYKAKHWDDGEWGNMKVAYESNLKAADKPANVTDAHHSSGCSVVCSPGPCSCGLHDPLNTPCIDAEVNGEDIDLVPPEAAQQAAQDALDARANEDVEVNGMTEHGWSRAEQLASGEELSPSDIVGSTGAMAPWWSRHASHTIEGDSLAGSEKENPWEDNSYTAGKGWGGVAGYKWAIRKGNEIKRARGEKAVYSVDADVPMKDGTMYGAKPEENLEQSTVNDDEIARGDIMTNQLTDGENLASTLRSEIESSEMSMDKAKSQMGEAAGIEAATVGEILRGDITCPPMKRLSGFADVLNVSQEDLVSAAREDGCNYDSNMTEDTPEMDFDEWVGGLSLDALAERNEAVAELQADVGSLRDEKETVEDEKDALAEKVEDLQDSLRELERDEVAELIEEITSWTDAFGSEDELLEAYDEGEKSREAIESHHDTAKQIAEDMGVDLDDSGGKRRSSPIDDGAVVSGDEGGEDTEYGHGGVYNLPAQ